MGANGSKNRSLWMNKSAHQANFDACSSLMSAWRSEVDSVVATFEIGYSTHC